MWNSVMLFWWVLHLSHVRAGAIHGNGQFDETQPSDLSTAAEPSSLYDIGEWSHLPHLPNRFSTDKGEEMFMENEGEMYNMEEDVSGRSRLEKRAARSPRRCFRHQESCLGHQLPCCDPCDTCYCRFFNAICYCRRIGGACLNGRP